MKTRFHILAAAAFIGTVSAGVFFAFDDGSLSVSRAAAEEIQSVLARGGRLYDNWYSELDIDGPEETHPSYPSDVDRSGAGTWRCKECHGWDYLGVDGAYGSGSHRTGIKGVNGLAGGDAAMVAPLLRSSVHGFTEDMLTDEDIGALAMFLTNGQIDMDAYIDRASKAAKGNAESGEPIYNTVCANCHGIDGKDMSDIPPMGELANDNPWEVLHKILNGQPDEEMPALRALDHQISADILAYMQTLPE